MRDFLNTYIPTDLILRGIKIIDIGFIAVLYFLVGYYVGYYLDMIFLYIYCKNYETKTKTQLLIEILIQVICIGVVAYIGRNLVQLIPFPLNGYKGFQHMRVKEVSSGGLLSVFLVMFQYNMQDKLKYIKKISENS